MTLTRQGPTLESVSARLTWRDAAVGAAVAAALCALMTVALAPDPVSGLGYALSAVAGGAFGLARRAPLLFLVIAAAALVTYTAADEAGGPIYVALFVAAMNLAARTDTTRGWLPWVAASGVALVVAEAFVGQFEWHFLLVFAL